MKKSPTRKVGRTVQSHCCTNDFFLPLQGAGQHLTGLLVNTSGLADAVRGFLTPDREVVQNEVESPLLPLVTGTTIPAKEPNSN